MFMFWRRKPKKEVNQESSYQQNDAYLNTMLMQSMMSDSAQESHVHESVPTPDVSHDVSFDASSSGDCGGFD